MKTQILLMATALLCSCSRAPKDATLKPETPQTSLLHLLLGSYSPAEAEGIRLYDFDQDSGEAIPRGGLAGIPNPSFLCMADNDSHFLSVSETDDGKDALFLFQIEKMGENYKMEVLGSQPTLGKAPCYVNYHAATRQAFTANYNGGSLSAFTLDLEGQGITTTPEVIQYKGNGPFLPNQQQAHIHCAQFSPDSTMLYICDLGSDCIRVVQLPMQVSGSKSEAPLKPEIPLPPGSGPRHLTFSANGRYAYLINELSGYVTVLANETTTLTPIQYAQCDSVGGHGSADIHLSPDGRFLYASNRLKEDGISIFSIDSESGLITKVGYQRTGIHPRNFAITPNGRYLLCACRDSNEVQIYSIDSESGMLASTGNVIKMPQPVFVMLY